MAATYADALATRPPSHSDQAVMQSVSAGERKALVEAMNREYALVLLGDRPAVLREGVDAAGHPEVRLLTVGGFTEWVRPWKLWVRRDGGGVQPVPASKVWLESDDRRQYLGLTFAPEQEVAPGYYNLWKGFAVQPDPTASCQRFLDHVAENVCGGDESRFAWVMGWFAQLVQYPAEKPGTSLVLRGPQGVGKSIVGDEVGSLLHPHYQVVASDRFVTGRFNAHLVNCLLLQLDEATWGGDHAAAGKLKDLITGTHQLIEFKGKEPVRMPNYVRVLITSNNEWVVPAGLEDRRFTVLDVHDTRIQDQSYFLAIRDEMRRGGRGALLHYLMHYDLSDVPVRQVIATDALREQKIAGMSPELAWWLDILMAGELPGDRAGVGETPKDELYDHYINHAQRRGVTRRQASTAIGIFLKQKVPGLRDRKTTVHEPGGDKPKRQWVYAFPPLAACRAAFDKFTRTTTEWPEPTAQWGGGP